MLIGVVAYADANISIDNNVPPRAVRELMISYQNENPDLINPFSGLEDESLLRMPSGGSVLGDDYGSYSFEYEYDGDKYFVNFLYDYNNNKAYIVNDDRYSPDKISLLFKNLNLSINNINFDRIEVMAYYIGNHYAPMLAHIGTNEMYHNDIEPRWFSPIILPNVLTEEQIKKSYFFPELKIIQCDELRWELKFLVYLRNGSIYIYTARGDFTEDNYFRLKNVEKKEIYPKGSIKVYFPGVRDIRPDAKDAFYKYLEENDKKDND